MAAAKYTLCDVESFDIEEIRSLLKKSSFNGDYSDRHCRLILFEALGAMCLLHSNDSYLLGREFNHVMYLTDEELAKIIMKGRPRHETAGQLTRTEWTYIIMRSPAGLAASPSYNEYKAVLVMDVTDDDFKAQLRCIYKKEDCEPRTHEETREKVWIRPALHGISTNYSFRNVQDVKTLISNAPMNKSIKLATEAYFAYKVKDIYPLTLVPIFISFEKGEIIYDSTLLITAREYLSRYSGKEQEREIVKMGSGMIKLRSLLASKSLFLDPLTLDLETKVTEEGLIWITDFTNILTYEKGRGASEDLSEYWDKQSILNLL